MMVNDGTKVVPASGLSAPETAGRDGGLIVSRTARFLLKSSGAVRSLFRHSGSTANAVVPKILTAADLFGSGRAPADVDRTGKNISALIDRPGSFQSANGTGAE